MKDSSEFINKYIQVVTSNEVEIEGTLLSIEDSGILLKDTKEDEEGNDKETFFFIPSRSIDHLYFDPERDY